MRDLKLIERFLVLSEVEVLEMTIIMIKHLNIRISGQVQGVSFRYYAAGEAKKLGINGFVRNEPAGSVYIEAEGDQVTLDQFVKWCQDGPEHAQVEKVDVQTGDLKKYPDFRIL